MKEREITRPVSLTLPGGALNPDAIGWTRTPLHDTAGVGRGWRGRGRNKRWEYWAITTPSHVVAVVVSDIDYAGLSSVFVLDRRTGAQFGHDALTPLAIGTVVAPTLERGSTHVDTRHFGIRMDEVPAGTRIRCRSARIDLDVVAHRVPGRDRMGVVVPWSDTLFQYTVKDVGRPATGRIRIDGADVPVPKGRSHATLDHGRGRWPYAVEWNWGAGIGETDGREVAVQVGGRWTDGTGSTENALIVDGRLSKISAELTWSYDLADENAPWAVTGEGVELTFAPEHVRRDDTDLVVLSSHTVQAFGHWNGRVRDEDGNWIRVADAYGWAEDVRQRW